jgi:hypothetical protein
MNRSILPVTQAAKTSPPRGNQSSAGHAPGETVTIGHTFLVRSHWVGWVSLVSDQQCHDKPRSRPRHGLTRKSPFDELWKQGP